MPKSFRPFMDINELIDELKRADHLWYQAPMDARPHLVHVRQYTVSNVNFESSRAMLWTRETGAFSIKLTQHFDRFRKEEEETERLPLR